MMPIGAPVGIGTNLKCESKSVHPIHGVETQRSEEDLKSHQVNYVNISMTGITLIIQNAKVYQVIILINCGMGKYRHIGA